MIGIFCLQPGGGGEANKRTNRLTPKRALRLTDGTDLGAGSVETLCHLFHVATLYHFITNCKVGL